MTDQDYDVLEDLLTSLDEEELVGPTYSIIVSDTPTLPIDIPIMCFIKYCKHTSIQAEQLALNITHTGNAIVKSDSDKRKLLAINEAFIEHGLDSWIEEF